MPEHKPQEVDRLRSKLQALADAIIIQAEKDPDFLSQLETILSEGSTSDENKSRKRKHKKIDFDAVAYLSAHSVNELKQYLLEQEETNLPVIAKQEGLKSLSKKLSKEEMVDKIVGFVDKTLNQGVSFLKIPSDFERSSPVTAEPDSYQELLDPTEILDLNP